MVYPPPFQECGLSLSKPSYLMMRLTGTKHVERSPSEQINGFDGSSLISTGMNIANAGVRSPTRACVRNATLTRADVLALLTSLNCILSCLVDAAHTLIGKSFPKFSGVQNPHSNLSSRFNRRCIVDPVQTLNLLWQAIGLTDQISEAMIDSGSKLKRSVPRTASSREVGACPYPDQGP